MARRKPKFTQQPQPKSVSLAIDEPIKVEEVVPSLAEQASEFESITESEVIDKQQSPSPVLLENITETTKIVDIPQAVEETKEVEEIEVLEVTETTSTLTNPIWEQQDFNHKVIEHNKRFYGDGSQEAEQDVYLQDEHNQYRLVARKGGRIPSDLVGKVITAEQKQAEIDSQQPKKYSFR